MTNSLAKSKSSILLARTQYRKTAVKRLHEKTIRTLNCAPVNSPKHDSFHAVEGPPRSAPEAPSRRSGLPVVVKNNARVFLLFVCVCVCVCVKSKRNMRLCSREQKVNTIGYPCRDFSRFLLAQSL